MAKILKQLGRLIPRTLRTFIRSPVAFARWWWLDHQPDAEFSPGYGWKLRCPPTAISGAFHLQLDDPEQKAEFAEFMGLIGTLRDPLFLDIGCHFGLFGFAVADRCGAGSRVVAIDPSATACAMVRRIAATNRWADRITVLQAAMGSERGELEMIDAGVMAAGYFVLPTDQPRRDRTVVPQRTIDDLAAELGRTPDLIKIDVEGFEAEVLIGGRQTLTRGSIPLCLEIHNGLMRSRGAEPKRVLEQLAALGYRNYVCEGRLVGPEEILRVDIIRIIARKG